MRDAMSQALNSGNRARSRFTRGSSMIEFTISAFLLVLILLAALEFDRMLLAYTSLCNSTKAAVRYAIVHGNDSSQVASTTDIQNQVKTYLAGMDTTGTRLTVNVSFPSGQDAGNPVVVTAQYSYDPWVIPLPLNGVRLSAKSQGIITW
jgi:Flp pilus assembly protein TadG